MPNDPNGFIAFLLKKLGENIHTPFEGAPPVNRATAVPAGGDIGSPLAVLRPLTQALGRATTPLVGDVADVALSMAAPIGPAGKTATMAERAAGMGRFMRNAARDPREAAYLAVKEARNAPVVYSHEVTPGAAAIQAGKSAARKLAPTPAEMGQVEEMIASAKQYGLPNSQRVAYQKLLGPESASLPDHALVEEMARRNVWPTQYIDEMSGAGVNDLVKRGYVSPEEAQKLIELDASGNFVNRGTINSQMSENLRRQAATMKAKK